MHLVCGQKDMIEQPLSRDRASLHSASSSTYNPRDRNVLYLLARREICPNSNDVPRKKWGAISQCFTDAKRGLTSWVESESLKHLTAKYSPLNPPPRSTIAAAFSPDGKSLASTHGDHTVKIIDCRTGNCLKVLNGHRRTPWVVRFNPMHPDVLASGSLDYEVRLWNAKTAECIGRRDFYRPIASIAFHAEGDILAVASGHKLFIWHYNKRGETSSPTIILKTRRSIRAVHFHPHAAPFLLTAEVNDLDSSDSPMTRATSPGYLRYPPPAVFFANIQPNDCDHSGSEVNVQVDTSGAMQNREASSEEEYGTLVSPMEVYPSASSISYQFFSGLPEASEDMMDTDEAAPAQEAGNISTPSAGEQISTPSGRTNFNEFVQIYRLLNTRDPWWEVPFIQGWLMGQSQAGFPSMLHMSAANAESNAAEATISSGSRHRCTSRSRYYVPEETRVPSEIPDAQPIMNRIQSEIATSLAAATAAELPCTVKLRVWAYDIQHPCTPFTADKCRLTIPHAVLCSEMGAHFSPCGRYLAACVACMLPNMDGDPGSLAQPSQDSAVATSPTRHPISAHQVMYELRIYSLEEATFGTVLVSRAIRAAHCLTSIQFSPTSEHILLAYGRRHGSLLKSIVINGETTSPIYTVLEVYRVSDMELVKILPSAEDEVNVACFHPFAGGGLVYGTKEGKLRVLQLNGSHRPDSAHNLFSFNNLAEVQTYALEG